MLHGRDVINLIHLSTCNEITKWASYLETLTKLSCADAKCKQFFKMIILYFSSVPSPGLQ